jgi:hypothetical protein
MGENINIIKKNSEALLDISGGLEVNTEKTKHCSYLVTRLQDKIFIQRLPINPLKMR